VDVCYDGVLHRIGPPNLANNFKTAKLIFSFAPVYFFMSDKAAQLGFLHALAKGFQFVPRSFGDQFHAAISQIFYCARHFESTRNLFHCVTEPDTLHVTRIKDLNSLPIHREFVPICHNSPSSQPKFTGLGRQMKPKGVMGDK